MYVCAFIYGTGRKIARNVMAMATGEVTTAEVATTELPEFVKTIQKTVILSFIHCSIYIIYACV